MPVGIHSLGRYPLSLILCHLQEVEGTSLLITCKRFANHVLPLFRLKRQDLIKVIGAKHRHQFLEYPAQDPEVLLQRLNTHRLRKRLLLKSSQQSYEINKTTGELALSEPINQKWPAHLELLRFLTRADQTHGTSLLVSYPRSGNTLLRNLLERLSGIVTGSDNRPDRKLSRDLATKHNLVGEGVISNRNVHIVKTHYPERTGSRISDARRAILLVRNPYDAIDSYWNLNLTNTHTETVTDNVYAKHQDTFDDLASNEMKVWSQFHRYWLEAQIPVLVVRFEDLITNLNGELSRIARFLLMDSKRVSHASDTSGQQELGSYRPRMTGTRPFGKSLEKGRYSDNIIDKFHAIATQQPSWRGQTLLQYFGYDILTQDFPNNFWNQTVTPIDAEPVGGTEKAMEINAGYELRAKNDAYGRSMKQWRLDHTSNDQDPFPIVPR